MDDQTVLEMLRSMCEQGTFKLYLDACAIDDGGNTQWESWEGELSGRFEQDGTDSQNRRFFQGLWAGHAPDVRTCIERLYQADRADRQATKPQRGDALLEKCPKMVLDDGSIYTS